MSSMVMNDLMMGHKCSSTGGANNGFSALVSACKFDWYGAYRRRIGWRNEGGDRKRQLRPTPIRKPSYAIKKCQSKWSVNDGDQRQFRAHACEGNIVACLQGISTLLISSGYSYTHIIVMLFEWTIKKYQTESKKKKQKLAGVTSYSLKNNYSFL